MNKGLWSYDGEWSLVEGTRKVLTWWQGPDDRIEAIQAEVGELRDRIYNLYWVHGGERTQLPAQLPSDFLREGNYVYVPGSLIKPE